MVLHSKLYPLHTPL